MGVRLVIESVHVVFQRNLVIFVRLVVHELIVVGMLGQVLALNVRRVSSIVTKKEPVNESCCYHSNQQHLGSVLDLFHYRITVVQNLVGQEGVSNVGEVASTLVGNEVRMFILKVPQVSLVKIKIKGMAIDGGTVTYSDEVMPDLIELPLMVHPRDVGVSTTEDMVAVHVRVGITTLRNGVVIRVQVLGVKVIVMLAVGIGDGCTITISGGVIGIGISTLVGTMQPAVGIVMRIEVEVSFTIVGIEVSGIPLPVILRQDLV